MKPIIKCLRYILADYKKSEAKCYLYDCIHIEDFLEWNIINKKQKVMSTHLSYTPKGVSTQRLDYVEHASNCGY